MRLIRHVGAIAVFDILARLSSTLDRKSGENVANQ